MNTKLLPSALAIDLTKRSICAVQVAAVVFDTHGIFGWGWNSAGADGMGEHAECHAIRRANRVRLSHCSIAIAGRRKRTGKIISSFPCANCMQRIAAAGIQFVWVESQQGLWQRITL